MQKFYNRVFYIARDEKALRQIDLCGRTDSLLSLFYISQDNVLSWILCLFNICLRNHETSI